MTIAGPPNHFIYTPTVPATVAPDVSSQAVTCINVEAVSLSIGACVPE